MQYLCPTHPRVNPACPLDALPELLQDAAWFAVTFKEVPPAIALTDALAAAGAVVHCGYDCLSPNGELMPSTLNTCVVAPASSGKGTSFRFFFSHFLSARKAAAAQAVADRSAGKMVLTGRPVAVESMAGKLSFRKLMELLDGNGMCLAMQGEEGESFLKSDLFRNDTDALTQLWSGDPPLDLQTRGTALLAANARCCLGIRIQPEPMYAYLMRRGRLDVKLGVWPRAIVGCHDPERFPWNNQHLAGNGCMANGKDFLVRMSELAGQINERFQQGITGRIPVQLSHEASAFMAELRTNLRQWSNGPYTEIREAAGRAWENTLRVAVVLHVFCRQIGHVSLDMVLRAWAIIEWSLSQHLLVFVESLRRSVIAPACQPTRFRQRSGTYAAVEADIQFMLDTISCRSAFYRDGKVPIRDLREFCGFPPRRFTRTISWILANSLGYVEGTKDQGLVCLIPPRPFHPTLPQWLY